MKIICPNCKTNLVQTSHWPDALQSGDEAECGKCGHVWTPKPLPTPAEKPLTNSVPVALKAHALDAGTELVAGGFMCVRCAQQMDDCKCRQSAAYFL